MEKVLCFRPIRYVGIPIDVIVVNSTGATPFTLRIIKCKNFFENLVRISFYSSLLFYH